MDWSERFILDEFHKLYYEGIEADQRIFEQTKWFGVPCLKCPLDLWVYQEIICEIKPDLIIETGTYSGGSALYLAQLCDALGHGHIATIDVMDVPRPAHPRVTYIKGSSIDPAMAQSARACVPDAKKIMVILDSDHSEAHVLEELRLYAPMVGEGSYLIVEDTNVNGHPARPEFGPGPYEAVTKFLAENPDFVPDRDKEKFLLTFNPRGYLRRLSSFEGKVEHAKEEPNKTGAAPDLIGALEGVHKRELERLAAEAHKALQRSAELEGELAKMNGELAQKDGELAQKDGELAQKDGELARTQAELDAVRASLERLRSHWLVKSALRIRRALLDIRQ